MLTFQQREGDDNRKKITLEKKLFLRKHVIFCTSLGNLFEVADI